VVEGAFWTTATMAAVLFLLMLFDRETHRALNAYNQRVLQRAAGQLSGQDLTQLRRRVFGSLKHHSLLNWTMWALGGEMMLAMLINGRSPGPPTLAKLAFSGLFVTMLTTILQVKKSPVIADLQRSDVPPA
jgi:hypothetical protein